MRQIGSFTRHSHPAALTALGILLLWIALPTVHTLTAPDCHNQLQCPVCESLHHSSQFGPTGSGDLAAPELIPLGIVASGSSAAPVRISGLIPATRAPPAA